MGRMKQPGPSTNSSLLLCHQEQSGTPEQQQQQQRQQGGDEAPQYRLEEGDGSSHAQQIVRELYKRYEKQLQRWKDYRNLFAFLAFVALYLAVLYLQRDSDISYQVHNTIDGVVTPVDSQGNFFNPMGGPSDVYNWLNTQVLSVRRGRGCGCGWVTCLVTTCPNGESLPPCLPPNQVVWQDPVCGDGICEAPFEFASYSSFGCRADCGLLQNVQNLTTIQVDIYFDFSHPVGSMPSSVSARAPPSPPLSRCCDFTIYKLPTCRT